MVQRQGFARRQRQSGGGSVTLVVPGSDTVQRASSGSREKGSGPLGLDIRGGRQGARGQRVKAD
jgi:hypothetical protein